MEKIWIFWTHVWVPERPGQNYKRFRIHVSLSTENSPIAKITHSRENRRKCCHIRCPERPQHRRAGGCRHERGCRRRTSGGFKSANSRCAKTALTGWTSIRTHGTSAFMWRSCLEAVVCRIVCVGRHHWHRRQWRHCPTPGSRKPGTYLAGMRVS